MLNFFKNKNNKINSKKVFGDGVRLEINSQSKKIIEQVKIDVEKILKESEFDINKMIEYIEVPVLITRKAKFIKKLYDEYSFFPEQYGINALVLCIFTGQGIKFYTPPSFVLEPIEKVDKYEFLHQFYKYYSYKSGLSGFDYKIQNELKLYFYGRKKMKNLSLEEITLLKEAIARDNEATDFVFYYRDKINGVVNDIKK